jgi:hypothetical protein
LTEWSGKIKDSFDNIQKLRKKSVLPPACLPLREGFLFRGPGASPPLSVIGRREATKQSSHTRTLDCFIATLFFVLNRDSNKIFLITGIFKNILVILLIL